MNNLTPLGLLSCFILSMVLNGTSISNYHSGGGHPAYLVNHSSTTIYFKPESAAANPGLQSDASYPLAPGASLYQPVDAIITSLRSPGKIYRVPTGSRIVVDEAGQPHPANFIAGISLLLPAYGYVSPPSHHFAKLANIRKVLYRMPDIYTNGPTMIRRGDISAIAVNE